MPFGRGQCMGFGTGTVERYEFIIRAVVSFICLIAFNYGNSVNPRNSKEL
jgi:hypothetical protein